MLKRNILIFLFSFSTLFAHTLPPFADGKIYCLPEQIELRSSIIVVHLDDQVFEVDALLVDQGGIFFLKDMMRCLHCRRPLNPKHTCQNAGGLRK